MLNVQDVLTEQDVLVYDSTVLDTFGATPAAVSVQLAEKRRVAVEDWMRNQLTKAGYAPNLHSIRDSPGRVFGVTNAVAVDLTGAMDDKATDDVAIGDYLVTPDSDYLYVGHGTQPAGLWVTMLDAVNVNTLTLTAHYWNGGAWQGFTSPSDGTSAVAGVGFSGGGRLSWSTPANWQRRPAFTDTDWKYWLRLSVNSTLTPATRVSQVLPLRRSALTHPCALYALHLLYMESWGVQRGGWETKAEMFGRMAKDAALSAVTAASGEFVDLGDESVDVDEHVTPDPSLNTWERG